MSMKCPKCQAENPEAVKFCGDCGTALLRGPEPNSQEFRSDTFKHEPQWRSLRPGPRFKLLLKKLHLE